MWSTGQDKVRTTPNHDGWQPGDQVPKQRVRPEDNLQHDPLSAEQGGSGTIQTRSG